MLVKITRIWKVLNLFFHFSYLYLYLARYTIVYTLSQGTNREKYVINYNIKVKNADSGRKKSSFHSISSFIGRAFSIFQQKNQRSWTIRDEDQNVYSRADVLFTVYKGIFMNGKKKSISFFRKSEIKITNCMTLNMKRIWKL